MGTAGVASFMRSCVMSVASCVLSAVSPSALMRSHWQSFTRQALASPMGWFESFSPYARELLGFPTNLVSLDAFRYPLLIAHVQRLGPSVLTRAEMIRS